MIEATGVWPVGEHAGWIRHVHRRTDFALGYGLRLQEEAVVRGMVLSGQHAAILATVIYFALRIIAIEPT